MPTNFRFAYVYAQSNASIFSLALGTGTEKAAAERAAAEKAAVWRSSRIRDSLTATYGCFWLGLA